MWIFEIPWGVIICILAALLVIGKWITEGVTALFIIIAIIIGIVLLVKLLGALSDVPDDNFYASENEKQDDYWCND